MKLLSVNVTLRIGLERISFAVCPEIGQARPTVHASLMQRLSDVLTSMMQRRSQRITSVTSPVGSPVPEPAFPAPASVRPQHQPTQPAPPHRHHRSSLSEPAAMSTTPPVAATEDIDFVSYESLGRPSLDFGMAAEPAEAPLSSTIPTACKAVVSLFHYKYFGTKVCREKKLKKWKKNKSNFF